MRIVFMGTPDFAVPSLQALIESEHQVLKVVTQPDRPHGRGYKMRSSPIKEMALRYALPINQPQKASEIVEELRGLKPDLITVAAFGQILKHPVLEIPKYGCINVHASLLPRYRGAAPIQQVILNGEKVTGITIMYMAKGLDEGDIILQKEIEIDPKETYGTLHDKLSRLAPELLLKAIDLIAEGRAPRISQDHSQATYAHKIDKGETLIDWSLPAPAIERRIRAFDPHPPAFTYYKGRRIIIGEAEVITASSEKHLPGEIIDIAEGKLKVATGEGMLAISELQPAGKRRMKTSEFIRGYRPEVGEVLGRRR